MVLNYPATQDNSAIAPEPLVALHRTDAELLALFAQLASRSDVANLLEISDAYLRRILYIRKDRLRYRRFAIPKRSGGERTISAPSAALAILQSKLNRVLQLVYRPKPCVHGFVLERSVLSNSQQHAGKQWVLNIDLKDFFPSINFGRIRGSLMASPLRVAPEAATILAQICTMDDGVLPQGAPTSPILSNFVCARMDSELIALARRTRTTYTRYADDLTFSSNRREFPDQLAVGLEGWNGAQVLIGHALAEVVKGNGFEINGEKTRLQRQAKRQEVTGLTVNEFPNVRREYIRQLRAMIYAWRAHGLPSAATYWRKEVRARTRSALSAEDRFRRSVRGRLEFLGMVRGRNDAVYAKLRAELHALDSSLIDAAPTQVIRPVSLVATRRGVWVRQFERWRASVVQLEITRPNGDINAGTAFSIGRGLLATAAHNLVGSVTVTHVSGAEAIASCTVHALGPKAIDAAIISVAASLEPMLLDRRLPDPGETIAIIGFPSIPGLLPTLGIHVGVVETITSNYTGSVTLIQISVPSGGGLSGSPVLDDRGRLIGLVSSSRFEKVGDGVPGREYCSVLPIEYVLAVKKNPVALPLPITIDD